MTSQRTISLNENIILSSFLYEEQVETPIQLQVKQKWNCRNLDKNLAHLSWFKFFHESFHHFFSFLIDVLLQKNLMPNADVVILFSSHLIGRGKFLSYSLSSSRQCCQGPSSFIQYFFHHSQSEPCRRNFFSRKGFEMFTIFAWYEYSDQNNISFTSQSNLWKVQINKPDFFQELQAKFSVSFLKTGHGGPPMLRGTHHHHHEIWINTLITALREFCRRLFINFIQLLK